MKPLKNAELICLKSCWKSYQDARLKFKQRVDRVIRLIFKTFDVKLQGWDFEEEDCVLVGCDDYIEIYISATHPYWMMHMFGQHYGRYIPIKFLVMSDEEIVDIIQKHIDGVEVVRKNLKKYIEKGLILQSGTWYEIPDGDIKFQGEPKIVRYLSENPHAIGDKR